MATNVAAMKAKLGTTSYYILSMKAQELVDKVKIPRELEGWEDLSVEERYQRDLNYNRVRKQIAPYFAHDNSRFFGGIIIAALNFDEEISFEPLQDVLTKNLPNMYKVPAANMGFLTFSGGEVLIPLDGQHRLKAIEFAVTGRDEKGRPITEITPCTDLAKEEVTVILVAFEPKAARKIFTRVNRYAKATTAGQNYVTDDDDVFAVLAREVTNALIHARLVKFTSNTLTSKDEYFTTLAIVYNCNVQIIEASFPNGKVEKSRLPSDEKVQLFRHKVREIWETLLEGIDVFADALDDPESTGDDKRREIRSTNLLGKPVAQECLVRAYLKLVSTPTNLTSSEACERLNRLPWGITEENIKTWDKILWTGGMDGRILTKRRKLAADVISYMAGEKISETRKAQLLDEYRMEFPEGERNEKQLPIVLKD